MSTACPAHKVTPASALQPEMVEVMRAANPQRFLQYSTTLLLRFIAFIQCNFTVVPRFYTAQLYCCSSLLYSATLLLFLAFIQRYFTVVHRFYTALLNALAWDSSVFAVVVFVSFWFVCFLISVKVVYLQRWRGWCHLKLLPSRRKFCVLRSTMHHVTSCKATYVRCMRV